MMFVICDKVFLNSKRTGVTLLKKLSVVWGDRNVKSLKECNHVHTSEMRLYGKVLDTLNEVVMLTNSENLIISINKAFTKVTGYTKDEVIGKNPMILSSGNHDEKFYKHMWEEINTNGKWVGEVWNKNKDGKVYPETLSISAIKNDKGEIINYIGLFYDISTEKETKEQIEFLAHFDTLTDLPNSYSLHNKLESLIKGSNLREVIALLYIDLDRMKLVNDCFGHIIGDQLIKACAKRLRNIVKEDGYISRLGGDEFSIIVRNIDKVNNVENLAKKINDEFKRPFYIGKHELITPCSIGVSFYPFDGKDASEMIKSANAAMYKAKIDRSETQLYKSYMHEDSCEKMKITNELYKAIARSELSIHYQPQLDIQQDRVVGVEALIRWNHRDKGIISPLDFLPLAEETGIIIPMGEWVLYEVCHQVNRWESLGIIGNDFKVAVNLSALQFIDESLIETLKQVIYDTKLDPKRLELEITESISLFKVESIMQILKQIRELGIRVALDDFGTGYASLSYLKSFEVESLKIDKSFIKNVNKDCKNASIVKAIMEMATGLDLDVIAEGVETQEELSLLKKLNCKFAQGYLFAKPMPVEELEDFYYCNNGNIALK